MTAVLERDLSTAPRNAVHRVFGDTPNRLKLLTAALAVLGLLLGLVAALGLQRDSSSLSSLKSHTTEVSATSDLYYRLNDMDAQAANLLLVGYHPTSGFSVPATVNAAASDKAYEQDRSAADADLAQIAQNPLLTSQARDLLNSLGGYEADIAQAFYIDKQATNQQPAIPPAAALTEYKSAYATLQYSMLPASLRITASDSGAVKDSYSSDHSAVTLFGYAVLGLALLAALALVLGNRYYKRRFNRRLSWLSAGAVVAVVIGLIGLTTQLSEAGHLHVAKPEAYDSIYALDLARAWSDDANADESRWLLENRDPTFQTSYFQKVSKVAGIAAIPAAQAAADPSSYYGALSSAVGKLRLDAAANSVSGVGITGYLGTELTNVTFSGEAQAADTAAKAFNEYAQDDGTIRAYADNGNLAEAVRFDIGTGPSQSNTAFNAYMTALGQVIQVNTTQFDAAVSAGQSGLGTATWAELVVLELLLLLAIAQAGYLRLREYR